MSHLNPLGVRQISLLMLLDFIQQYVLATAAVVEHCSQSLSSLEGKGVTTEQWGCIKSFGLLHGWDQHDELGRLLKLMT